MRDLLSKLDALISEETTLQDLKQMPIADDPVIAKAIEEKEKEESEDPEKEDDAEEKSEGFEVGDFFGISTSEDFEIGTEIIGLVEDGIVITLDETALEYLVQQGFTLEEGELVEDKKKGVDGKACWKGYRYSGREQKADGTYKDKCVKVGEELEEEQTDEAKYQGREVPLGKPMRGDVKKSKVYVRGPKGNVVKVNFGDKKMRIKKSNPNRRKSFRARHNCANPGPRWKARFWSCRAW